MKPLLLVLISLATGLGAQTGKRVLLRNGIAHIGNGQVIENSYVAFSNGKIDFVSDARLIKLDMSKFDTTIDVSGKHIYPGFIAPNCILGLQEAEAIRATSDYAEVGNYNPHIRSLIAYNTDSKILETVKANGILYTQATPRYGVVSGSSSVLATDGWNWEDALLKADDGVHLNFPNSVVRHGWWAEPQPSERNTKFQEQLTELQNFFENAYAYYKSDTPTETNLRYEAMKAVFDGRKNLYLHADYVKDIMLAVNLAEKFNIKKKIIVGGKDSYKITPFLKEHQVAVMLNRLHDLPELPEADTDIYYKLPSLLQKDSILFCLQNQGDMEAMNARNLPYLAGTAAAYGLSKEQALQSITLNAAKILGVDSLIGSLETGKMASLVVSGGDVLDMRTSKIEMAYVNGRPVNITNFQNDLYRKYAEKYGVKP